MSYILTHFLRLFRQPETPFRLPENKKITCKNKLLYRAENPKGVLQLSCHTVYNKQPKGFSKMKQDETKVPFAYCVELDEVVDIDTAIIRSAERNYCTFNFLCAYEKCRQIGVKFTATNYYKKANERIQAAHFKLNNNDTNPLHHQDCFLYKYQQQMLLSQKNISQTDTDKGYKIQLDDITEYSPRIYNENNNTKTNHSLIVANDDDLMNKVTYSKNISQNKANKHKTSSFSIVCNQHYHYWKESDNPIDRKKQMKNKILKVPSGITTYFDYFKMIKYQIVNQDTMGHNSISFGFIYPKKYGNENTGIRLYFNHKYNNESIYALIKSEDYSKLKHKGDIKIMLDNINKLSDPVVYCTDFEVQKTEKSYCIIVNPNFFWIADFSN